MDIISRGEWGAPPFADKPATERTKSSVVFHWHGAPPKYHTGRQFPLSVDAMHKQRGWLGIGYNFAIDRLGVIYEGRSWNAIGAHTEGHNTGSIGVILAVGKGGEPANAAMLASAKWIVTEARRRFGTVRVYGHGDLYPTECPGQQINSWITGGMPIVDRGETLTSEEMNKLATLTRDSILGVTYGRDAKGSPVKLSDVIGEIRVNAIKTREASERTLAVADEILTMLRAAQ